jgi:cytoskeletal protein RodZ
MIFNTKTAYLVVIWSIFLSIIRSETKLLGGKLKYKPIYDWICDKTDKSLPSATSNYQYKTSVEKIETPTVSTVDKSEPKDATTEAPIVSTVEKIELPMESYTQPAAPSSTESTELIVADKTAYAPNLGKNLSSTGRIDQDPSESSGQILVYKLVLTLAIMSIFF